MEPCINTEHQDIIHDIALDWYGTQLATASSDKQIKIHRKVSGTDKWLVGDTFEVSGSSCLKVCWARPQFGTLLAVACIDSSFKIFEKKKKWTNESHQTVMGGIEDIKFIPYQQRGLILAVATSDGTLKLYQANDIKKLQIWIPLKDLRINTEGINSLSWNKNHLNIPFLVLGCKDYKNSSSKHNHLTITQEAVQKTIDAKHPTLCFAYFDDSGQTTVFDFIAPLPKETANIKNVSWALLNGRSFHMVGVAGELGVFILCFTLNSRIIEKCDKVGLSQLPALRVSWNLLATVIGVSEVSKKVRLFNRVGKKWTFVKEITDDDKSNR